MFWKRHRAGESNVPFSIRPLTVKFSICNPLIVKTKLNYHKSTKKEYNDYHNGKHSSKCFLYVDIVFFLFFTVLSVPSSCFYWNMTTFNFIYKPFIMVWDKTVVDKKHTPCDIIWSEMGRWDFKLNSNYTWLVKVMKTLCKRS